MNAFYHKNIKEGVNLLSEEEARHCIQILRHRAGDEVLILEIKNHQYNKERMSVRSLSV